MKVDSLEELLMNLVNIVLDVGWAQMQYEYFYFRNGPDFGRNNYSFILKNLM